MSTKTLAEIREDLGVSLNVNCGKPVTNHLPVKIRATHSKPDESQSILIYRIYHNSVVDGPGRRSVIQVAGCSIRCKGCYVPETHELSSGRLVPITAILQDVIANRSNHDGVTILGGEPLDQPKSTAELVSRLRNSGLHITIYTGYTLEQLIEKNDPAISYVLTHIDLLIDGPFLWSKRDGVGEYRGSANQRIIGRSILVKG